jgi:glycosyltransferase involved in cell wall biosynthesis
MKKYKLAYFVSHPIQYQAPMLKEISNHPEIDLTVFFQSDISLREYEDTGFGVKVKWDIDLLDGYNYKFLNVIKKDNNKLGFFRPIVSGVYSALKSENWDAVWFHGYNHHSIIWAMILCKQFNISFFMRMEANLNFSPKGEFIKDKFINYIVKNSSGLLYIGKDNYDYLLAYGANEKKLFSVPYTVNNDFFQKLSNDSKLKIESKKVELGLDKKLPIILYASKFIKRKNPIKILEALERLGKNGTPPEVYLLYIGDGEEKTLLENKIKTLGWEGNVKLLGFKNQSELPLYFTMCDVFVLPSNKEPYGLIVNEVLNCAKPIITTTEVGSAKDLISHGQNGFLYEPDDIKSLSEYLQMFIKDRALSYNMGKKSVDMMNKWSYTQNVEGVYEALQSLNKEKIL